MVYCSILGCKNDSRTKNLMNGGVTYHRFPKKPDVKEAWINSTGRINWFPAKSCTICSEHFSGGDILISEKGKRYIKTSAIPTLKIVLFFTEHQSFSEVSSSPSDVKLQGSDYTSITPKEKDCLQGELENNQECQYIIEDTEVSNISAPTLRNLEKRIRWMKDKVKKQDLKIKQLQYHNRRLTAKLLSREEILKVYEENFSNTKQKLDCLQNINTQFKINLTVASKICVTAHNTAVII